MREIEIQKTTHEEGWVEIRIVYHRPVAGGPDYHVRGKEARDSIAHFVLSFAGGIAAGQGFADLAVALEGVWQIILHRTGRCGCGQQHH